MKITNKKQMRSAVELVCSIFNSTNKSNLDGIENTLQAIKDAPKHLKENIYPKQKFTVSRMPMKKQIELHEKDVAENAAWFAKANNLFNPQTKTKQRSDSPMNNLDEKALDLAISRHLTEEQNKDTLRKCFKIVDGKKALLLADAQIGIDKELQAHIIEKSRLVGGLYEDMVITSVDSTIIEPEPVNRGVAGVVKFEETDGTLTYARNFTGTGGLEDPTDHLSRNMAYDLITNHVINDTKIDLIDWFTDQVADSNAEVYAKELVNGDGIDQFNGVLAGRVNAVESIKEDDVRPLEFFKIIKSGVDGGLGTNKLATWNVFIASLPTKSRRNGKVYMHSTVLTEYLNEVDSAGSPVFTYINGKLNDTPVKIDDHFPKYDGTTPQPLFAYGDINLAMKTKMVPSEFKENQFRSDGGLILSVEFAMHNYIQDNNAFRIFQAEA